MIIGSVGWNWSIGNRMNPYSRTKLMQSKLISIIAQAYNLPSIYAPSYQGVLKMLAHAMLVTETKERSRWSSILVHISRIWNDGRQIEFNHSVDLDDTFNAIPNLFSIYAPSYQGVLKMLAHAMLVTETKERSRWSSILVHISRIWNDGRQIEFSHSADLDVTFNTIPNFFSIYAPSYQGVLKMLAHAMLVTETKERSRWSSILVHISRIWNDGRQIDFNHSVDLDVTFNTIPNLFSIYAPSYQCVLKMLAHAMLVTEMKERSRWSSILVHISQNTYASCMFKELCWSQCRK